MRTTIPPKVRAHVKARDAGCLGPRAGMPGDCRGRIELDHIENGGLSLKGESIPENLASLCSRHHRIKTERATYYRVVLIVLVDELEQRVAEGRWPMEVAP